MITKEIQRWECDDLGRINLPEFIQKLQSIVTDAPCGGDEIFIEFFQAGDQWDGYSCAEITISRPETPEETSQREIAYAKRAQQAAYEKEMREMETYRLLKAKFGE